MCIAVAGLWIAFALVNGSGAADLSPEEQRILEQIDSATAGQLLDLVGKAATWKASIEKAISEAKAAGHDFSSAAADP
jgi:hypothetical protein